LKFSLSTGTLYPYPLRWVLSWARQAGFDGVELVVNPEAIARGGAAMRRLAEAEGVPILSVHPTVIPLPGWRERGGGMEPTIRLAREAGAGVVVMHTPRVERLDEKEGLCYQRRIEAWQNQIVGANQDLQGSGWRGLRLAVENKAVRRKADLEYALTPLDRLRAFADRYDLGLVLDTTHAGSAGDDLLRAWRVFEGRLVNVHLSDMGGWVPLGAIPPVRALLGQHRFPGAGDLALAELLADLASSGYSGPVTLEVGPVAVRAWWPPAVRRRLAQAIAWMRQAAGERGIEA
jgi:sugar phosphate isomerase/epimerase